MLVDPYKGVRAVEERIASTSNPRHKQCLITLRTHLLGEAEGNPDQVLESLNDNPTYQAWGAAPSMAPVGREAVRAFYERRYGENRSHSEYDLDRIVIDDDVIVTDFKWKSIAPAKAIISSLGSWVGPAIDDPDCCYLLTGRMLVTWPFDSEGLLKGEEAYAWVKEARRLTADEMADVPPEVIATYA